MTGRLQGAVAKALMYTNRRRNCDSIRQRFFNNGSHHKALRLRICPSKNQEPYFLPTCLKARTIVLLGQSTNS